MSLGFIMLAHTAPERAAQVARFWAEGGAPVVIHLDKRMPEAQARVLHERLSDLENVSFSKRFKCEWGMFGIVAATLAASEQMLERHPEVSRVCLASGSCLPLRPLDELRGYLDARPHTDFIESVTTSDVVWSMGGLDSERFSLRFPFSWRKRRRLFDGYTRLQRRLRFRRKTPEGLTPHLGSQWWCLTRHTLQSILQDPERPKYDRYFSRVWIPDESYFQTLARQHSTQIESRSLTLTKFDYLGKPHVFYDDHLALLQRSDCFMARKAWPMADKLYDTFLSGATALSLRGDPAPSRIDRLFTKAVERRTHGRPGLYMQSRFPELDRENGKTSAPYSVFQGFTDLFEGFESWLVKASGARVHGHIFGPERVEFAGGAQIWAGCLSDAVALRDHDPRGFLTNLVWNARAERQCLMFSPRDNQALNWFTSTDPNAQISVISGAWVVPLFHSTAPFTTVRREAARLQQIETDQLGIMRSTYVKARIQIWTLAEFIESPMEPLQTIVDEINPRSGRRLAEAPKMVDLAGFGQFLQNLRNQGMQPRLTGDFPIDTDPRPNERRGRPFLVR